MIKLLSKEKLEKLTTKRLLAYKNTLLKVNETSNWDDKTLNKESLEWKEVYNNVKQILSKRENIEK